MTPATSLATRSGSAAGRSILLIDRDDLEIGLDRQEEVRQRLGLHTLRRIDDENRALARCEDRDTS